VHSIADKARTVEEVHGSSSAAGLKQILQSKGRIIMEFCFITNMRARKQRIANTPFDPTDLSAIGAIPEKALKGDALSHQATYVFVFAKIRCS
jgi:hypothetical protein